MGYGAFYVICPKASSSHCVTPLLYNHDIVDNRAYKHAHKFQIYILDDYDERVI